MIVRLIQWWRTSAIPLLISVGDIHLNGFDFVILIGKNGEITSGCNWFLDTNWNCLLAMALMLVCRVPETFISVRWASSAFPSPFVLVVELSRESRRMGKYLNQIQMGFTAKLKRPPCRALSTAGAISSMYVVPSRRTVGTHLRFGYTVAFLPQPQDIQSCYTPVCNGYWYCGPSLVNCISSRYVEFPNQTLRATS